MVKKKTPEQVIEETRLIDVYDTAGDIMYTANMICITIDKVKIQEHVARLETLFKAMKERAGKLPDPAHTIN